MQKTYVQMSIKTVVKNQVQIITNTLKPSDFISNPNIILDLLVEKRLSEHKFKIADFINWWNVYQ